jgi:hypothetical protein
MSDCTYLSVTLARSYLEGGHEFAAGDGTIFVLVKVVVEGAELLSAEEDAEFGEESLEFELFEDLVVVLVEGLK